MPCIIPLQMSPDTPAPPTAMVLGSFGLFLYWAANKKTGTKFCLPVLKNAFGAAWCHGVTEMKLN